MKPNPKTQLEKQIRAHARRSRELCLLRRNAPLVPLREPIQRGFVRTYVLTPKAERRHDSPILRDILKVIGTEEYYWRRTFTRSRRAGKKRREIPQPLKEILIDHWIQNPDKFPPSWTKFFKLEYRRWSWSIKPDGKWYFVFCEPHLFQFQVRPHFITHEKLIDPLWIQENRAIERWMESRRGWRKYDRLKGRSWNHYNYNPKPHLVERQAKRELFTLSRGFEEVETRWWFIPLRFSFSKSNATGRKWPEFFIITTQNDPVLAG